MYDFLDNINKLSNYSFKLGINDINVIITLPDDETVSASDFLRMLENGSSLHNIITSRPIEKTLLTMSSVIMKTYEECIALIIQDNAKLHDIDAKMINLANELKLRLQYFVSSNIQNYVICEAFYKERKIN